jgi:hypothetical protein
MAANKPYARTICLPTGKSVIAHSQAEFDAIIESVNKDSKSVAQLPPRSIHTSGQLYPQTKELHVYIDPLKTTKDLENYTICIYIHNKLVIMNCTKEFYEANFTEETQNAGRNTSRQDVQGDSKGIGRQGNGSGNSTEEDWPIFTNG